MMILAPIAAMLIQLAISRSREYDADAASAKYVGSPYPLINGLQQLEGWSKRIPMEATPSTAHLFIIKPFVGQGKGRRFSAHPFTEKKIARLSAYDGFIHRRVCKPGMRASVCWMVANSAARLLP